MTYDELTGYISDFGFMRVVDESLIKISQYNGIITKLWPQSTTFMILLYKISMYTVGEAGRAGGKIF